MPRSSTARIAFIATAWGAKHGGINSFNTSLMIAFARTYPNLQLACVVLNATTSEVRTAKQYGIDLISLDRAEDEKDYHVKWVESIIESKSLKDVNWWVGHDVFTLPFALALRKAADSGNVAGFMHASFSEYSHIGDDPTSADPRALQQRELFPSADLALAVGPLLHTRLADIVACSGATYKADDRRLET